MRLHHLARITIVVRDLESAIAEHRTAFAQAQVTQLLVPEARAIALGVPAIAAARAAFVAQSNAAAELELIELASAQPASEHLGWAGFEHKQNLLSVRLKCVDSAVSAAFYLGLGAIDVQRIDTQSRIIRLVDSALHFESSDANVPAMDLANLSLGVLSVQLARVGSRGQSGPLRVLRGPDAELIELV